MLRTVASLTPGVSAAEGRPDDCAEDQGAASHAASASDEDWLM